MTLLVSAVNPDCIVLANDLRGDDTYTIDSTLFKHSWVGPGTLALFASDDVDSCNGILERVRLVHTDVIGRGAQEDPYAYADAVADTGRRVLSAAFGREWRDKAPASAFVIAGFRRYKDGSHSPLVLNMTVRGGLEPKPFDKPIGVWGADEIAKYWVDHLNPDWPLKDDQLAVLAVFLIRESSLVLDKVGNTAFLHVIKPGHEPSMTNIEIFRRLDALATRMGDNLRNSVRRDLNIRTVPPLPFPPDLFPSPPTAS